MLQQVLREIENVQGVVNLNDIAHKLDIERSALEGMIQFWVRKGRLRDDDLAAAESMAAVCTTGNCGGSCHGPQNCAFVMEMPRTFSFIQFDEP